MVRVLCGSSGANSLRVVKIYVVVLWVANTVKSGRLMWMCQRGVLCTSCALVKMKTGCTHHA